MEVDIKQVMSGIRNRSYKYLGSGSGRVVFDLNDGTVVKVAANIRGIVQNRAEKQIFSAAATDIFAKVLYASDDFQFLIMEKAERIRDMSYVWNYFNVKSNSELRKKEELKEIAFKHDLILRDLGRAVNWGAIKGKPVIVDYGFTQMVRRRFY